MRYVLREKIIAVEILTKTLSYVCIIYLLRNPFYYFTLYFIRKYFNVGYKNTSNIVVRCFLEEKFSSFLTWIRFFFFAGLNYHSLVDSIFFFSFSFWFSFGFHFATLRIVGAFIWNNCVWRTKLTYSYLLLFLQFCD